MVDCPKIRGPIPFIRTAFNNVKYPLKGVKMGLISGSVSLTRYLAGGDLPKSFMEGLSEKIGRYAFRKLDEKSIDERSAGWVNIMDMFDNRFAGIEFLKEPYIAMSLRVDERKIPSTALKQHCLEAEEKVKEYEKLEYLPKGRRLEIKEGIRLSLLKRAIPVSRNYDMIWNYTTGLILFGCTSKKLCDEFTEIFSKTFDIELQAICPYTLAGRFLEKEGAATGLIDTLSPSDFSKEI